MTFRKILLWLGSCYIAFDVGSVVTSQRVIGNVLNVKHQVADACSARQTILLTVDRSGWTDEQRKAFDDMCSLPSFFPQTTAADRKAATNVILFFAYGFAICVGVLIVRALKPARP